MKGPTKAKNDRKGAYKGKNEAPYEGQNEKKYQKVPRAYESLNLALMVVVHNLHSKIQKIAKERRANLRNSGAQG